MKKLIAFGVSFLLGLITATSLPTNSSEADQLPSAETSKLVSNEVLGTEPAACPCRGS
jgi:hypothetical protein